MMIEFEPISDAYYEAYLEQALPDYAAEHVRSGRWTADEAEAEAAAEFERLLPEGPATPDHFLRSLVDGDSGETVGFLWYWLDRKQERLFIYDIRVDEAYRRRGYAGQALQRLEAEARRLGARQIGLHVFGRNHAARALYEKMGYEPTNIILAKEVGPEE